ncbi:N alpha-acetyl-transferase [Podospora bellae-mahoneyi]|uniref:N-alpha-acetyltransferase 40 n=1 Tax=Podospora bellae-mahoneyi TaxID=2093777 RepID=A0ABR0FFU7_9PEZI|nr:N alpha-acetyl-transferase [Podospora bellae-mahoneyi]
MMKSKRSRAATSPIDVANRKTDEEFIADYLLPDNAKESSWVTAWTHPRTGAKYTISLAQPANLKQEDLDACFDLLVETSKKDYENSAGRWHPDKKLNEMRSPELRYVLVKEEETGELRGFTSLMPTYEEGEPVVYCYEVHLKPDLQGTGLGSLLMSFLTAVAVNLPPITKVMLTCFLSNARGLAFYRKLGFERDNISPVPRILRGKVIEPDYLIMSKRIRPDSESY